MSERPSFKKQELSTTIAVLKRMKRFEEVRLRIAERELANLRARLAELEHECAVLSARIALAEHPSVRKRVVLRKRALAHDDAARTHFGEFAVLNFPRDGERGAGDGV